MRLLLFLVLTTTTRSNAVLLAASMPLISTLFSGHPVFPKSIIISIELVTNAVCFYLIYSRLRSILIAATVAVLLSKLVYYAIKYAFIMFGLLDGRLVTTPLGYQLIPVLVLPFLLLFLDSKWGKAAR
jgi:hypothetical protein